MKNLSIEDCNKILKNYNISEINDAKKIDTSHGDEDLRQNYILDNKYVLRINNAEVFSENRFEELNRLISRYREFGVEAPLFLKDGYGRFINQIENNYFYLSEYIDGTIPNADMNVYEEKALARERLQLIASFARKYKNVDISDRLSMYSLFELSPYDALTGIDEKQDNLNRLIKKLSDLGEKDLSLKIKRYNVSLRKELVKIYKSLPKCVFQGDENWNNIIIDEDYHIKGIFDFNMAGTEVIVNYFANNALLFPSALNEDTYEKLSVEEAYDRLQKDFRENTELLNKYYSFSEVEVRAYDLYANISMISIYPNECALEYWLDNNATREKTVRLLYLLIGAM